MIKNMKKVRKDLKVLTLKEIPQILLIALARM